MWVATPMWAAGTDGNATAAGAMSAELICTTLSIIGLNHPLRGIAEQGDPPGGLGSSLAR